MSEDRLVALAEAIRALSWSEMVKISEHIANEVPHLAKSERMDRDGVAQSLAEMSDDIIAEARKETPNDPS